MYRFKNLSDDVFKTDKFQHENVRNGAKERSTQIV